MSFTVIIIIGLLLAFMFYTFDVMNRIYKDVKYIRLRFDKNNDAYNE